MYEFVIQQKQHWMAKSQVSRNKHKQLNKATDEGMKTTILFATKIEAKEHYYYQGNRKYPSINNQQPIIAFTHCKQTQDRQKDYKIKSAITKPIFFHEEQRPSPCLCDIGIHILFARQ